MSTFVRVGMALTAPCAWVDKAAAAFATVNASDHAKFKAKLAAKAPVKNVDLWQRLDAVVSAGGHQIDWRWVRGHAGDPGNERADALANKGVEMALANGRADPQR